MPRQYREEKIHRTQTRSAGKHLANHESSGHQKPERTDLLGLTGRAINSPCTTLLRVPYAAFKVFCSPRSKAIPPMKPSVHDLLRRPNGSHSQVVLVSAKLCRLILVSENPPLNFWIVRPAVMASSRPLRGSKGKSIISKFSKRTLSSSFDVCQMSNQPAVTASAPCAKTVSGTVPASR